jgi:hypothetical protein
VSAPRPAVRALGDSRGTVSGMRNPSGPTSHSALLVRGGVLSASVVGIALVMGSIGVFSNPGGVGGAGVAYAGTCTGTDQNGNTYTYPCDGPSGQPPASSGPGANAPPGGSGSSPAPQQRATGLRLSASVLTAGQPLTATASGTPGRVVDLYARLAPSSSDQILGSAKVPSGGSVSFSGLYPSSNGSFQARERGNSAVSSVLRLPVRSAASLAASRTAARRYTLHGVVAPHRGGVAVTVYQRRADGSLARLGAATTASNGSWQLRQAFTSNGSRVLLARTTADSRNASGTSPAVTLRVS